MPPKRKNAAVAAPTATKRVKTIHTPKRRSPRHNTSDDAPSPHSDVETKPTAQRTSRAVKPPVTDEDHEWEILDGDTRETLLVGITAPNRLTLRFRHRNDKQAKIAVHKYKKAAKQVDWSSKEEILDINKWRNQVFVRTMKFPRKVPRTSWTPFETAYLELLHEKLKRVASTDGKFTMPHNTKILETFNEYFEFRDDIQDSKGQVADPLGARQMGQLTSYMNRPGSKLRQLRKDLSKYKTSYDGDAYLSTMTDAEIQSYLDGDGVIDLTKEDAVPGEPAQDPQSAPSSPPKKRPKLSNPQKPPEAHQDTTDNSEPKRTPRWVKPKETAVIPSTPEYIASLAAQGYKWTWPPGTDFEALKVHKSAQDKRPSDNKWIHQATRDLDDRIARRINPGFKHKHFNCDVQERYDAKGAMKNVENWHEVSARRDGAAAVTGLLNAADLPPHGYTGDIRELHEKRLLSEGELEVADARDVAIKKKHDAIERRRLRQVQEESGESLLLEARCEREKRLQRGVYDEDSDVTRADDTDDEDGKGLEE